MGMVVKNNMSAVRTLNTLNSNTSALQKSLQKVSSGMKINSAQDDASGYAISERMRVRIRSLDQANQNSQNDSSLMKTAEGAVGNTVEILRALKEKAINAANDSNTDEDRQTIQKEINQFIDQIDDNALVQFNGKYLVDGSKNNAFYKTKSILLNQSLEIGTRSTSALTDLNNRAGDSLGIQTTDKYQVSWVQNGTVNVISGDVGTKAISDILTLKNTAGDQISQVKATDASGLISGPNEEEEEATPLYTISAEDAANLESSSAGAKLVEAYKTYINSSDNTSGATDGDAVNLDVITDGSGNRLYSSDGKEGSFTDVTIQKDATTNNYTLTLPPGATELKIYSYEKQPVTYPAGTNAEPVTDGYTTYNAGGPAGTLVSSLPDALANQLTETATALSGLTQPSAGDTIGDFTVPTNAEADSIAWTVLDSSGTEVTDGTSYAVRLITNATDSKDYLIMYTDDTATTAATAGYKIGVKFTIPEEETNAAESGLDEAWDKFGKAVYTPDKTEGIAFGATEPDVNHQISGLTVNILDQDGNVKKAANAALDQFKQYQRAENETGDMSLNFHIGSEANVAFKVGMGDMRAQALGLKGSDGTRIDVYTKDHANAAINVIENALTKALDQQTTIGAIEARLEYTSTNLTTSSENVQAAESTIRDADMAKEMTNYTKSNVLLQAAQAMLAQANQNSSAVLSLLQ